MLFIFTWMADAYWSILLPILETMGVWDTLDAVLMLRKNTWDLSTTHHYKTVWLINFTIASNTFNGSPFLGWFIQEFRLLPNLYKNDSVSLQVLFNDKHKSVWMGVKLFLLYVQSDRSVPQEDFLYLDVLLVAAWVTGCLAVSEPGYTQTIQDKLTSHVSAEHIILPKIIQSEIHSHGSAWQANNKRQHKCQRVPVR